MSAGWKFFRVICLLHLILSGILAVISFTNIFETGSLYYLLATIFSILMAWLAILGLNLVNNNYPDKPVAGKQKTVFNWLFLFNFLLLAYLFGLVFSEYRELRIWGNLLDISVFRLPLRLLLGLILNISLLIFQLYILYGLYILRRLLYINFFRSNQFEFENK